MIFTFFKRFLVLFALFSSLDSFPSSAIPRQDLIESFKEVQEDSPRLNRSTKASSREEAFELLKGYCHEMISYHKEMAAMFQDRQERYERYINAGLGTPPLDLFLRSVLGIAIKGTPPADVLTNFLFRHKAFQDSWTGHLGVLTNEEQIKSDGTRFKLSELELENKTAFERTNLIINELNSEFKGLHEAFTASYPDLNKIPPEYFAISQVDLDQFWSIRYAQTLLRPWAKPDEELQKEQDEKKQKESQSKTAKQQKKRDKKKRYKQRKEQEKLQLQAITAENTDMSSSQKEMPEVLKTQEKQDITEEALPALEVNSLLPAPIEPEKILKDSKIHIEQKIPTLSLNEKKPLSNEVTKQEETQETFDSEEYIKNERALSLAKKKNTLTSHSYKKPTIVKTSLPSTVIAPIFTMDKESFNTFTDLFKHRSLEFIRFAKAFTKGLDGQMLQNKGGSMRTFQRGKFSFILHEPHGHKGTPMFYDELRQRAIRMLEKLGVTESTICLRNDPDK